jgi:diguanylate cyclase (GGDEF)-like protein
MRKPPLALFSDTGRHVAWAVILCGFAVLALGLLLQAGKQQRQYRTQHQLQLRQAAVQAAELARGRIDQASLLLRLQADSVQQLRRLPMFATVVAFEPSGDSFAFGQRRFVLSVREREAVENGRAVLLDARDTAPDGRVFLLRAIGDARDPNWVLVGLRPEWLWAGLGDPATDLRFTVFDGFGRPHFSSAKTPAPIAELVAHRLGGPLERGASDLSWSERGQAWVGAMARVGDGGAVSDLPLAVVATDPDQPWSVAFWSALRTQSTMIPLLLLLAAWLAHDIAGRRVHTLRLMQRAIAQLPDRRAAVPVPARLPGELRSLVEAYNRSAEVLEAQALTRRVLEQIDALLLPGGDYENVLDQVLTRIRSVTRARNVGLTLVDPGVAGYGRLFVVNAEGGAPVNRVVLDPQMVEALGQADGGLTIARCEQGRHSFLEPLQEAGSNFFWVWPVMAADDLAAILAVGYVEPPSQATRIVDTGTMCAQRLGLSLSTNARAERLYRQAHFDPLTQLPNRQLFRDQLHQELESARRDGTSGALLYIDLDHFKRVNDALGHEAGDQLLEVVAKRLQGCVKEGDTVARLGGDEFTVILRNIAATEEVAEVADRIIDAMRQPVRIAGRDNHVYASIGITQFPADGTELDELLHHADLAMYRAKDLGRGGAVFYGPQIETCNMRADSGLFRAMSRRELSLYYQPQYRVSDGQLVGIEALLRWQTPRGTLLSSADFIPAAEESGLIVDLGGWVIEAACAQIAQWREAGVAVPRMSLNLSPRQLRDPGLVPTVQRQLERHRLQPAVLELEMNEAALTDPENAPAIESLSELGVRLTLDDFGTGNTALGNLRRYPVSAVKIDRSFVAQLAEDPSAAALAGAIIVMAHSLDKQVVAEGVETMEQLDYLREHDCDLAQGFFLARPLSAQEMTGLLLGRGAPHQVGRAATA